MGNSKNKKKVENFLKFEKKVINRIVLTHGIKTTHMSNDRLTSLGIKMKFFQMLSVILR